ncbi:DHH family phosphoesterase, partial [bacterium]|nr:DHH family phosphoesterase [bacterium]
MEYSELNNIIKSSKNILIISHVNPDGDTLGSMCGLYCAILANYKKKCDMLTLSKSPDVYSFMPCLKLVKSIDDIDKSREYDLVINVDIASLDRICDGRILFEKAKKTINIDHHKTNNSYADYNFVNPQASSTGEVLVGIFENLNWKLDINC